MVTVFSGQWTRYIGVLAQENSGKGKIIVVLVK
jgi:hypothetical protein